MVAVVGVLAWAVACGSSDDAEPVASSLDGAVDGPVAVVDGTASDGGIDACAPGEEPTRTGCRVVVPAGQRRLALEINPPDAAAYGENLDRAKATGVAVVPITLPWSLVEPSAPDGGASSIVTPWFSGIGTSVGPRGLAVLLSMPLVDTANVDAPPDLAPGLANGTVAYDAPAVVARYEALVDAYFASVAPSIELGYLVVANEADVYLGSAPAAAWEALARFLVAIRDHVHATHPQTKVGINVTFGGVVDAVKRPKIAALTKDADVAFVSYYFGANGFGAAVGTDLAKDFDAMVDYAGAKPLVLKELGYPTATAGHGNEGQVDFVASAFGAWDRLAAKIPLLVMSRMYDDERAACEADAQKYGAPGNEEFIRFLCTLGLHDFAGAPKPGWKAFESAAKIRGF